MYNNKNLKINFCRKTKKLRKNEKKIQSKTQNSEILIYEKNLYLLDVQQTKYQIQNKTSSTTHDTNKYKSVRKITIITATATTNK